MSSSYATGGLQEAAAATNGVGLGYGIAIAVGILVLVSSIMLASYVCVRVKGGDPRREEELRQERSSVTISATATAGLDGATIESYPKFIYGGRALRKPASSPCSICLSEYVSGDELRRVPGCEHCFHAACVDEWLRLNASCPICRHSPLPSPAATPLSELVPLAFVVVTPRAS